MCGSLKTLKRGSVEAGKCKNLESEIRNQLFSHVAQNLREEFVYAQ